MHPISYFPGKRGASRPGEPPDIFRRDHVHRVLLGWCDSAFVGKPWVRLLIRKTTKKNRGCRRWPRMNPNEVNCQICEYPHCKQCKSAHGAKNHWIETSPTIVAREGTREQASRKGAKTQRNEGQASPYDDSNASKAAGERISLHLCDFACESNLVLHLVPVRGRAKTSAVLVPANGRWHRPNSLSWLSGRERDCRIIPARRPIPRLARDRAHCPCRKAMP
jgi:hypothetical protein